MTQNWFKNLIRRKKTKEPEPELLFNDKLSLWINSIEKELYDKHVCNERFFKSVRNFHDFRHLLELSELAGIPRSVVIDNLPKMYEKNWTPEVVVRNLLTIEEHCMCDNCT